MRSAYPRWPVSLESPETGTALVGTGYLGEGDGPILHRVQSRHTVSDDARKTIRIQVLLVPPCSRRLEIQTPASTLFQPPLPYVDVAFEVTENSPKGGDP
ncbi:hypothetical protein E5288_WYG020396 [Bos mutus]|uniref:Uncharacterized protein n=1 Tax=Bos mutus TaxID=72004 RepID=A0A6B0RWA8_9CETA|nr:hypothetical protein [Bos mutus]